MCVNFLGPDKDAPSDARFRRCGVDVSLDSSGAAHSAVARTMFYPEHMSSRYETEIAFGIREGTAQLEGFVTPEQPSRPHFKTVPVACAQVSNVSTVGAVERPEETLGRWFEHGRYIANQTSDSGGYHDRS
jgi:hypothetical protein